MRRDGGLGSLLLFRSHVVTANTLAFCSKMGMMAGVEERTSSQSVCDGKVEGSPPQSICDGGEISSFGSGGGGTFSVGGGGGTVGLRGSKLSKKAIN